MQTTGLSGVWSVTSRGTPLIFRCLYENSDFSANNYAGYDKNKK